jgi:hypothetical protein
MAGTSLAKTSAGTTLSIASGTIFPATYDLPGFGALTYVPIAEITDLGEFGKKFNLVKHNPLGNRTTFKRKGSYDNGAMAIKMAKAFTDAGQSALLAARDSDNSYAYKVTYQDGTYNYFSAQCMSVTIMISTVDTITGSNVSLEVDGDVL